MSRRGEVSRDYGGVSADTRRAERREKLLTAARHAWGEGGVGAVTVRGVCGRAGLGDRYFYEHFLNRDALVLAVADDVRDQLLTTMVTAGLAAAGATVERLTSALKAFLDAVADDPNILRMIGTDTGSIPGLAERRREVLVMIADLVVEHTPESERASQRALRNAANFSVGGVNMLIESWLENPADVTTDQLAATCARYCVAVLAAAG